METKLRQAIGIAQVGFFFAACDGSVAECESKVIENYKEKLRSKKVLSDENETLFDKEASKSLTSIDEVVQETKALLALEPQQNHRMLLNFMEGLIEAIILADGVLSSDESANFNEWKKQLKLA